MLLKRKDRAEEQRTGVLNHLTRPETVRHAPPAQLPVSLETEHTGDEAIDKQVKTPQKNSILFLAVLLTLTEEERNDCANTVNLTEALSFPTVDTDVAFMAKTTNKIGVTYGKSVEAMNTAATFFGTGDDLNLIHSVFVPPEWKNSVKKEALPELRTTAKQPLLIEGLITLHLGLGDQCTRIWLDFASQLAVNMLLITAFINSFICGIFPPERNKVLATNSNPD